MPSSSRRRAAKSVAPSKRRLAVDTASLPLTPFSADIRTPSMRRSTATPVSKQKSCRAARPNGPPKHEPMRLLPSEGRTRPPVSVMVIQSIQELNEPPRRGSSLPSIMKLMQATWPIGKKTLFTVQVKSFVKRALQSGQLQQTSGQGLNGRFTLGDLSKKSRKKKKRSPFLGPEFDRDEAEYQPKKTKRDVERDRDQQELATQRAQRALQAELQRAERAGRPKRQRPVQKDFEVEAIKDSKEDSQGQRFFLVKFIGYKRPQWEPEEHLTGCQELVNEFLATQQGKTAALEKYKSDAAKEGIFEVKRILDVKFKKDKSREFLIRWHGFGAEGDTWEPESNLNCPDLVDKFMAKWEKLHSGSEITLRLAPKRSQRMVFTSFESHSKRLRSIGVRYLHKCASVSSRPGRH